MNVSSRFLKLVSYFLKLVGYKGARIFPACLVTSRFPRFALLTLLCASKTFLLDKPDPRNLAGTIIFKLLGKSNNRYCRWGFVGGGLLTETWALRAGSLAPLEKTPGLRDDAVAQMAGIYGTIVGE
jgi:hypothetical protein